jgi:hypothetical protein
MSAMRASAARVEHGQREHGRARLGAVDQREPFFRSERQGRKRAPIGLHQLALADERQGQVRERREIAARTDGAARGHPRVHARVEHRDEPLERFEPDARVALREHVRAQRHQRAHDRHRQRVADTRRVTAQEVELEFAERLWSNGDFGQRAEAGVHAVHRHARCGVTIDDVARSAHARRRGGRQLHGLGIARDACEPIERQRGSVELNHPDKVSCPSHEPVRARRPVGR